MSPDLYGNGVIQSLTGHVSVNSGESFWINPIEKVLNQRFGFGLGKINGENNYWVVVPSLGETYYKTSIVRSPKQIALFSTDSIAWILGAESKSQPDTLCFASVLDSSNYHCITTFQIENQTLNATIALSRLVSDGKGPMYFMDPTGWYAKYDQGRWLFVDSIPTFTNSTTRFNGLVFGYARVRDHSQIDDVRIYEIVSIEYDNSARKRIDTLPLGFQSSLQITYLNSEMSVLFTELHSPVVIKQADNKLISLNSVVSGMEELKPIPILCGFVDTAGLPLVVGWHDALSRVHSNGIGSVLADVTRDEKLSYSLPSGPFQLTRNGLRSPFVGEAEVLFPGTRVRKFSRNGTFLDFIDTVSASCVLRLTNDTLLIASGTDIRIHNELSDIETSSLVAIINPTDSSRVGFVSTMVELDNGDVVLADNGSMALDTTTFEKQEYIKGGFAYSTDQGKTWSVGSSPDQSKYYLGMVVTASGAIVASATTVTIDTSVKVNFGATNESEYVGMDDRYVFRSTDKGRTWSEVYKSPMSSPMQLVGSSGVIADDGTILLMAPDGILQSTDDGLTWDFHDMKTGNTAHPISVFKNPKGGPVYYCTDLGLYQSWLPVSVEETEIPTHRPLVACNWQRHLANWKQKSLILQNLYSLAGEVQTADFPTSGVYVSELRDGLKTVRQPIYVTPE